MKTKHSKSGTKTRVDKKRARNESSDQIINIWTWGGSFSDALVGSHDDGSQ